MGLDQHPGQMERPFKEITFEGGGNPPVPMKIAEPFPVLRIGEMVKGPVMGQGVPASIHDGSEILNSERNQLHVSSFI